MMRASRFITTFIALALTAGQVAAPPSAIALAEPATSAVLPDLGMLAPKDFSIQSRPRGVRWLRFDTVVVNVGRGLFDVYGSPSTDPAGLPVTQRIEDASVGWTEFATPARMFHAGDGHNHWHVRDFQNWTLTRVGESGKVLGSGAKTGFCFWDNYRYGATGDIVYHPNTTSACLRRADGKVPMGMSVGWGDEYPSSIAFQYIDITALPNGDYVITLEADPAREFHEVSFANNTAWATIRITRKSVTVLSSGTDLEPGSTVAFALRADD